MWGRGIDKPTRMECIEYGRCYPNGQRCMENQEVKVSSINQALPFLNQTYRLNLACSLAQLLEDSGVESLLWGDILHLIHSGENALPHVILNQHPQSLSYATDPQNHRNTATSSKTKIYSTLTIFSKKQASNAAI